MKRSRKAIKNLIMATILSTAMATTAWVATLTVNRRIPVYTDAYSASQGINSTAYYEPGTYEIYKTYNGMVNISRQAGVAGAWMNPKDNATTTTSYMYTTAKALNFRSGPSTSYALIGTIPYGSKVEVLSKTSASFYKIRYNGTTGYAAVKYLVSNPPSAQPAPEVVYRYSTGNSLAFRSGPSSTYSLLGTIAYGSKVELVSQVNDYWSKIRYNGTVGFVASKYLSSTAPVAKVVYRYSTGKSLAFRSGPSTTNSLLGTIAYGSKVELISQVSEYWSKIRYNGTVGYVASKYLTSTAPVAKVVYRYSTGNSLAFRSGPSTTNSLLGTIAYGSKVELISQVSEYWSKIRYNGTVGYEASKYLTSTAPEAQVIYRYTTGNALNFRSGPGTGYSVLGTLVYGTKVELLSQVNDTWVKIRYNGKVGYVSAKYLTTTPPVAKPDPVVEYRYTTGQAVNFRSGPSTSYPSLTKLPYGSQVELIAQVDDIWYKVRYQGTLGYVSGKYLTAVKPQIPVEEPIQVQVRYANGDQVIIYSGVNTSYSFLGKIPFDAKVDLLRQVNDLWSEVSYGGVKGFVESKYLSTSSLSLPTTAIAPVRHSLTNPIPVPSPSPQPQVTPVRGFPDRSSRIITLVTADQMRTAPSDSAQVIGSIPANTRVGYLEDTVDGWNIVYYEGKVGYVKAANCSGLTTVKTGDTSRYYYILKETATFRTGPSASYPSAFTVKQGEGVYFTKAYDNQWVCMNYLGKPAFIEKSKLLEVQYHDPVTTMPATLEGTTAYVVNYQANIYSSPSYAGGVLYQLPQSYVIGVDSIHDGWAKVKWSEAGSVQSGYVMASSLAPVIQAKTNKPRIGLSYSFSTKPEPYALAVEKAGGIPVLLPRVDSVAAAQTALAGVDGMIFLGGDSVDYSYFYGAVFADGQVPGHNTNRSDYYYMRQIFASNKPALGVCRGMQLMAVMSGGTVENLEITDPAHLAVHRDPTKVAMFYHDFSVSASSELEKWLGSGTFQVNTFHRHIIDVMPSHLKIMGYGPQGNIEAFRDPARSFYVGTAFHPERLYSDGHGYFLSIFQKLVDAAAK